ncbi:phage portal protein [Clostridium tepidum]|uniref:Phage portal protein n=1 Tax=Clostridium tepidum TaxID=1962263 RepID=A0A1S9I8W1_9CLOT|nr:phage portal protein [Clostridium tepidum]OOO66764.1 phage portal protein [Clostridium tepidum]
MIDNVKIMMDITDKDINEELINKLLKIHEPIVNDRFKKLDNYYRGKHEILKRTINDPDKPNNKPVSNFCSYITDTLTGFFIGKPVSYTSNNKEYLTILEEIFKDNDEQTENHDLAHKSSIKGQSFELVYLDEEGKICFDCLDTDSVIMIYDTTVKNIPCAAIRYYKIHNYINDEDIIKIEIYTKTNIYHYTKDEDTITFDGVEEHYFKEVPIIEFPNNRYRRGDFENIITLNDMYNKNFADISNDIEYFSNCYLGISGAEGTTGDDIKTMKEDRVIIFPAGGDAKFITKQINDQVVNNHRNNLAEDIHKMSYVPDLSKEINSNVSGSALRTKMFTASDIIINKERKFYKGIQTRIRLITNILNLKGYNFNYKDISIHFHKNLPTGLYETADDVVKMSGTVSKKTLLTEIGIEDVDKEMEQIEAEKDTFNLDLIPDGDVDEQ